MKFDKFTDVCMTGGIHWGIRHKGKIRDLPRCRDLHLKSEPEMSGLKNPSPRLSERKRL